MEKVIKKGLKSPSVFLWLFLLFFISGCAQPGEQIFSLYKNETAHYEKLIEKNPNDFDLRLKLARIYYRFNDFQKAIDTLKNDTDKNAKIIMAKSYAKLNEHSKALELFDQIGETEDNEYLYLYANTLEKKNLYPKAVVFYKKVKGKLSHQSRERISAIGLKVEDVIPKQISELIAKEQKFLEKIDKEDAVVLLVDEQNEVKSDNTSVMTAHVVEKVLKEKGKHIAEVEIGYDSTYERVELEYARTITPEGKVIYAGAENIRDVTKYLNFPLYSNAKALIISMPSVDIGSIIDYKVKIYSSKLITGNKFSFIYPVREIFPIARAKFRLIIPKNDSLKLSFFNKEYAGNLTLNPKLEQTKDSVVYDWEFKEVKPIIPEEPMPPIPLVNPAIGVSNFSSWEEIHKWWTGLYKNKIILNTEVKDFVKNLTKGAKSDLEKAKLIYEFCAQNVRYVAVEYGESGFEPHYANDIFLNRYGDCKDKAILLVAMMREAGLSAYPVLIPTRNIYEIKKDFPSVNFNHAIAALDLEGKIIFMDATASTVAFGDIPLGDQQRNVLVFFDDQYKLLTTPLTKENTASYEMTLNVYPNEDALVERKVGTEGFFAAFQRYYLKNTHPDVIEADIQKKMVQLSPFSKLIGYKTENVDDFNKTPSLQYSFSAEKILNPANRLRILPLFDDIDMDTSYAGKESRSFPIEFDGLFRKISKITIKLPDNMHVRFIPADKEIITPWFDFKSKYTQDKNTIEAYREFSVNKRMVEAGEYKEFKKNMEEVFYLLKEEIVLEK